MDLSTVLSLLLGGGFITFVQFLITRYDNRNNQIKEVLKEINDFKAKVTKDIDGVRADVLCIKRTNEKERTINKRVRILRFEDELQACHPHSKDSFDQILSDIDDYEKYCADHPKFKNNQTATTVEHIKAIYKERLEKHDFL